MSRHDLRDPETGRFASPSPTLREDWIEVYEEERTKPRILVREKPIPWVLWYVWVGWSGFMIGIAFKLGEMVASGRL